MVDSEPVSVETLKMIADAFNRHDLDAIIDIDGVRPTRQAVRVAKQ